MFIRLKSISTVGIDVCGIDIEINIFDRGIPYFDIVGLPDKAVSESKHRVKTAVQNSGYHFPDKKILVNLAPANMPKQGSIYDFAIAAGIIICSNMENPKYIKLKKDFEDSLLFGELSLDGSLRYVSGAFLLGLFAKEHNIKNLFIPRACADDLSGFSGQKVYGLSCLRDLATAENFMIPITNRLEAADIGIDLKNIIGNHSAKRALEISAAGCHHLLFLGSPGVGKTTLAQAYRSIQPPMTSHECFEVIKIRSIAGVPLTSSRPFRSPHHTLSMPSLIGGGSLFRLGEITLAHHGVLFLDELSEFSKTCLEALRQPLENGFITISRNGISHKLPCEFTLVAASNPCPCGYHGHPDNKCVCTPSKIRNFRQRLSGPILDRIDMVVTIHKIDEKLYAPVYLKTQESSAEVLARITRAREVQKQRYKDTNLISNARLDSINARKYCTIFPQALKKLNALAKNLNISTRGYFRILKVARTIADLDSASTIDDSHISEALMFSQH